MEKILIKWLGSKFKELDKINEKVKNLTINNYYEPFVGGGSVFLNFKQKYNCNNYYINDAFVDLYYIYKYIKEKNIKFYNYLFHFINIFDNAVITPEIEKLYNEQKLKTKRNNEITIKKMSIYYYIRKQYNNKLNEQELRSAAFLFIRKYAYSGMFRYNSKGEFNVPYGGTGYDKNSLKKSVEYFYNYNFNDTYIYNLDYLDFINKFKENFTLDDIIFIDPPYDDSFSEYDKGNNFDKNKQIELFNILKEISANIKIISIMKGTEFIQNLYKNDFNIEEYTFRYSINFKERNKKHFPHILISNF